MLEAPRILTTKATCAQVLHLLHQLGWASSRAGQGLCAGVSEGRAGGSPAGGRDPRLSWRLPMSSQQRGQSPGLCWAPLLSSWLCPGQDSGRPWLGSDAAQPPAQRCPQCPQKAAQGDEAQLVTGVKHCQGQPVPSSPPGSPGEQQQHWLSPFPVISER